MTDALSRTRLMLGDKALEKLKNSRVILFGLGGVGGFAAEALARSGVGAIDLVDDDAYAVSNLNRQLFATCSTLGMKKTEAAKERLALVAPDCRVTLHDVFFLPETEKEFDFAKYDYVIDAIDTVTAKIALISAAKKAGVPVVSCMGTGKKMDPSLLRVSFLSETKGDPLARVMRKECKKRGVGDVLVVYSTEKALGAKGKPEEEAPAALSSRRKSPSRRDVPGSAVFVPGAAGLLLASVVVRDLIGFSQK